jgi:acetyltransferase-like isoleucine patch superfamily enzyme
MVSKFIFFFELVYLKFLHAWSLLWLKYIQLKFPLLKIEGKIQVMGIPVFEIHGNAVIKQGNSFVSLTRFNPVGLTKRCNIYVGKKGQLLINATNGFSGVSIVCWDRITIGSGCGFGGNVSMWDTDFHGIIHTDRVNMEAVKTAPIIIGNNVWVGANCMILKGVEIGDRSVIGAGSLVNKKIPAGEIWAGNPIKFIRKVQP